MLFVLNSQPRWSSESVVFDFNASLNDAAPVAPILFSVDLMKMEKGCIVDQYFCVDSFIFTI